MPHAAALDEFGPRLYRVWNDHEDELSQILAGHFTKHLAPFAPHAH